MGKRSNFPTRPDPTRGSGQESCNSGLRCYPLRLGPTTAGRVVALCYLIARYVMIMLWLRLWVCLSAYLSVCLSLCLSVCLCTAWSDLLQLISQMFNNNNSPSAATSMSLKGQTSRSRTRNSRNRFGRNWVAMATI